MEEITIFFYFLVSSSIFLVLCAKCALIYTKKSILEFQPFLITIHSEVNGRWFAGGFNTDFSKAFDKIRHQLLLVKLSCSTKVPSILFYDEIR
jgi:hypothetical protein